MPTTPTLLIVHHSQSGRTAALAEAVIDGARDPSAGSIIVDVKNPLETAPDEVLSADAYLFGTPENFGYMSGALKYFFDRIYYPLRRPARRASVCALRVGGQRWLWRDPQR